ncbi:glycosyltransferase [Longimicrobium terrae]|uniref:Glycosyltransferase involved in cell wall biosynthesis n=1 Tax=Longimicrobium terrae TaxID=1639882 RepID=A0A841GNX8_9BACT|nr:glycosyltransferase involved in cell wall biosynthesis [Longimicrobium terrae]MBB6068600.1 glycosyltransferase involved in cell wall biosynthesis [Longimicrobium terrae]NNC27786.1 glycosyltransferase family 4 protein [Longimicrobium terrae]
MSLPRGSRLCFVADGRSPIARNYIQHFIARGDEVHLISTFPFDGAGMRLASLNVVPAAFARFAGANAGRPADAPAPGGVARIARQLRARAVSAAFPAVFGWLAPAADVGRHVHRIRELILKIDPVLVHAMRIPFEGILAAQALEGLPYPLVMSVWGNDLELWAARYPLVARLTRRALARADALHPDCGRDLTLAMDWGWDAHRPAAVFPSNGGIRTSLFHPGEPDAGVAARYGIPAGRPVVLNSRGFRAYVRNDAFFRSIPLVLRRRPDAVFAAVAMEGHPRAQRWVRELGIGDAVHLLPRVPPAEMAELFRLAAASVSPSEFDGTPNTLLESMACGAFPVAGNIASVREWVRDGENGILFPPADAQALADATVRALDDAELRRTAGERNAALIRERGEYEGSMARAEALYAAAIPAAAGRGTAP